MTEIRKIRVRIYLAVEGEGEQSFVRFLQELADKNGLNVHLDCDILSGGGYKSMLQKAARYQRRDKKTKNKAKASILLVDKDRDERKEDGWSLEKLNKEAKKEGFQVCVQEPNQEGLLFRMLPGNDRKKPDIENVKKQLTKAWSGYKKPIDSRMLSQKFDLPDVLRAAKVDESLKKLLSIIGFIKQLS